MNPANLADHIAILLSSSLDQARPNKARPEKIEYYVHVALPPQAIDALKPLMVAAAPNGQLAGLNLAPKLHRTLAANKQIAGIPPDWFIMRLNSGPDYPPEIFLTDGTLVAPTPHNASAIRSELYSGQRVRLNAYAFSYPPKNGGAPGISFNLTGIMVEGGGERRAGVSGGVPSETAFSAYRAPADATAPTAASAERAAPAVARGAPAATDDPFQQGVASGAENPFV